MCKSSTTTVRGLVAAALGTFPLPAAGAAAVPGASLAAITLLGPPEEQERQRHQAECPGDGEHPGVPGRVVAAEKRLAVDRDEHVEGIELHELEQDLVAVEAVHVV